MINRICNLPDSQSFFLFGPRQTGKSTLVDLIFTGNVWKIDLLMTDQFLRYSKYPDLMRREALEKIEREGIGRIIIDEVQRVPQLLNEVHYLIEKTGCLFVLTGSSARKMRQGGVNLLAGRAVQRRLFPFVCQEISDTFDLWDVLRFGTLAGVYGRSQEQKTDILRAYTETYLKEEIQAEGLVRNLGGFSRFLDLAASQFGELISFTAIGRECQVPTRTVQSYYEILEDTLIGFRLMPWAKSLRKRLVAHSKFYLFDLGVTNSLNRQLTAPPDPVLTGRLFEQFIILETHRMLSYLQSEASIYFWRTNHGAEVDLIIEKHGKLIGAFEIKSVRHVTGSHLSGLRSFREDHPNVPLHVVSHVDHAYRIEDVLAMPWSMFLENLEEYLGHPGRPL
jgi:predicted AAA+ superfamily ATPase